MLSRRENLLIRPWEQRRYNHHRKKVLSALPVIDNHPPLYPSHVEVKLKQIQKENERCQRIERDNLLLLRKLSQIMRTSRVDNYWRNPQPNFLSRVAIYGTNDKITKQTSEEHEAQDVTGKPLRKLKCYACTPQKIDQVQIPEERIPWDPEKAPVSRKRSQSVPARKPPALPTISEKTASAPPVERSRSVNTEKIRSKQKRDIKDALKPSQSITLYKGSLKLAVNFPSDATVKFQSGRREKCLMQGMCNCKIATPVC